jgi:hypothetical protein
MGSSREEAAAAHVGAAIANYGGARGTGQGRDRGERSERTLAPKPILSKGVRGRPQCLEVFTYGDDHWECIYDGFTIGIDR